MPAYAPRVTYTDGEVVELGADNPYDKIDRTRLRLFELVHKETKQVAIKLHILPEQRLIWRVRTAMRPGHPPFIAHIIGKQQTVDGKNKQGIFVYFETDGSVEFMERFEEGHAFLSPVQLLPSEDWV